MGKFCDITGQKFNKLTVIKRLENSKWNETQWLCRCDCGNKVILTYGKIAYGHTKSCGCYKIEVTSKNKRKHGLRNTRLYRIWNSMKQRCNNPNSSAYKDYGNRGIKVCKEWGNNFLNFYNWAMNNGYEDDLTIDRINNNEGYYPNNCRWVTSSQQANNKRSNVVLALDNEVHNISEWCRITGLTRSTITHRLQRGWSVSDTLTIPSKK